MSTPSSSLSLSARRAPKKPITVRAMRSAPPDSTIILPRIVPSPTTSAIWPSALPTPASNALTIEAGGSPVTSARPSETSTSAMNGLSRTRTISAMRTATAAAPSSSSRADGATYGFFQATQSTSTLQSTTICVTAQARAGGFAPKYSLKMRLNDMKSRASSSHTPQRTTCSGP